MLWVSGFVRTGFGVRDRHLDRLHDDQYGNMQHYFLENHTPTWPNDWSIIPETAGIFFPGPVEADETCVGGREAGKHFNRKLRAGRGPAGKAVVAGIRDRETDRVVGETVARTPEGLVEDFTVEGASKGFSRAPATPRHPWPAPVSWLELLDRGSNGQGRWPFAVGRHG